MRLLVRCWNVFHGRTVPETRRQHLEGMIRLVSEDEPDVVCLQEVPVWALAKLAGWSGMSASAAVTKRALLGPLAGFLQRLDARRIRSPFTGQANVVLLAPSLRVVGSSEHAVSTAGERRIAQLVRVVVPTGALLLVNTHLTTRDEAAARRELDRIAELVGSEGPCVLCGDLNLRGAALPAFSEPLPGIDQILVRGLTVVRGPEPWPEERRRSGEVLFSDHAPLEAEMMWP